MDIKEFKLVVAQNIYYLRTQNHLTQYELGEKLNYSDKAISKWERGDGLPDAYVISKMSALFGVSVDYILTEHSEQDKRVETKPVKKAKRLITSIVVFSIITLAVLLFTLLAMTQHLYYWKVFVYMIPIICIVLIVFNSIWEKGKGVFAFSSFLMWSVLTTVYCAIGNYSNWMIFLIGIPLQIIVFFGFGIKISIRFTKKERIKKTRDEAPKDEKSEEINQQ